MSLAIYARQSVDRKDSISIEAQIDFCKYETKGEDHQTYIDRGYSGKNTERPGFQRMLEDIRSGKVSKVIVYKLDRISRSILDFTSMMEIFQSCGVEFVSATEKFDTSSPMGRAMLNICIVFAQLERETIQKRVTDSVEARKRKGFRVGGVAPRGFKTARVLNGGVHMPALQVDEGIDIVREVFSMYTQPGVSYKKILMHLRKQGTPLTPRGLVYMLTNPIYAQADMSIYQFFSAQGVEILSPPEAFTGEHGCYLYRSPDSRYSIHQFDPRMALVVAPTPGIIPASTWLACRRKILANPVYQQGRTITSWLVGKIYCGVCGHRMHLSKRYAYCSNHACEGPGKALHMSAIEKEAYRVLLEKLQPFLGVSETERADPPDILALRQGIASLDKEIDNYLASLAQSGPTVAALVNQKVERLAERREQLTAELHQKEETFLNSQEQRVTVATMLGQWDSLSNELRRQVADSVLDTIWFHPEGKVEFRWKV